MEFKVNKGMIRSLPKVFRVSPVAATGHICTSQKFLLNVPLEKDNITKRNKIITK